MKRNKQDAGRYTVGNNLSSNFISPIKLPEPQPLPTKVKHRKHWFRRIIVLLFLLIFIPGIILSIWNHQNYAAASNQLFGSGNLVSAFMPASLKGENRGRVNILIVGYSADDPDHEGGNLTDSIMVVSLSTVGKRSYMLSIPRDLYVNIPEYGRSKINEAYQYGEIDEFSDPDYPAGGIGLLEQTIFESLAIPIDYYALVNYAAVRDTTDALDGITVKIESSDPRGIYDPNFKPHEGGPLELPNGTQRVDGLTALRLTRARGAQGGYGFDMSDFDRTKNQQAVLTGIKDAVSLKLLLNPLKNKPLLEAGSKNVKTDVSIREVLPLYKAFNNVPSAELKSYGLNDLNGEYLLASYFSPEGQSVLIPSAGIRDFSEIQAAIKSLND